MTLYIQLIEQKLFLGPRAKAQLRGQKKLDKNESYNCDIFNDCFYVLFVLYFFLLMNILADYFTANTLLK